MRVNWFVMSLILFLLLCLIHRSRFRLRKLLETLGFEVTLTHTMESKCMIVFLVLLSYNNLQFWFFFYIHCFWIIAETSLNWTLGKSNWIFWIFLSLQCFYNYKRVAVFGVGRGRWSARRRWWWVQEDKSREVRQWHKVVGAPGL